MKVGRSENSGFVHETTFILLYQVLISAVNIQYTLIHIINQMVKLIGQFCRSIQLLYLP